MHRLESGGLRDIDAVRSGRGRSGGRKVAAMPCLVFCVAVLAWVALAVAFPSDHAAAGPVRGALLFVAAGAVLVGLVQMVRRRPGK